MAVKSIIAKLEDVSEALRGEYVEVTEGKHKGKFMLAVEAVDGVALEEASGLKSSLAAARRERDDAHKRLKLLGDHEPEVIAEAISKLDEIKNWKPDDRTRAQIDAQVKVVSAKHAKDLEALQSQLKARDAEVEDLLIRSTAAQAIAKIGANARLLMPHVLAATAIERGSDGKPRAIVKDASGAMRITAKQGSEAPMSVEEYVESLRSDPDLAPCFPGKGTSGAGTGAGVGQKKDGGTPSDRGPAGGGDVGSQSYVDALRSERRAEAGSNQ